MHAFEIIILGMAIVLMIWASIFSWRMDNLPSDKDEKQTNNLVGNKLKADDGEV